MIKGTDSDRGRNPIEILSESINRVDNECDKNLLRIATYRRGVERGKYYSLQT